MSQRPSIFCISSYEKGQAFLREVARLGCEVRLLTVEKLADADWPKDILTEFLTMPANLTPDEILSTVTYLARTRRIDRIVALDEFDMEVAALLREHMRLPGTGSDDYALLSRQAGDADAGEARRHSGAGVYAGAAT